MEILVAKTYQDWERASAPYTKDKRTYIDVRHPNTAKVKSVRVYTPQEYKRMYSVKTNAETKPQKDVLGFEKGYITIFKNPRDEEWFSKNTDCRYARYWGWYIISTKEVPYDLPKGVTPVRLDWEVVGNPDGKLKSEEEVRKNVVALLKAS